MNALILATFACLAAASAAPSGIGLGTVVAGPAGIVTGHGIGLGGLGLGGVGIGGLGLGGVGLGGVGLGGVGLGGLGLGAGLVGTRAVVAAPVAVGLGGVGAITAGGGSIAATGHGAAIRGPPTAPAVISGPAGTVAADGLWGPTANIGGHGALGAVSHWG